MCWTWGEDSFIDFNGNGLYDAGEPFSIVTEPMLDSDDSMVNVGGVLMPAFNPLANDPTTGQSSLYWDTNLNGKYDGYCTSDPLSQCAAPQMTYESRTAIWDSMNVIWTGPSVLQVSPTPFALSCSGAPVTFTVTAEDVLGNPLVGGSAIAVSTSGPGGSNVTFDNTNITIGNLDTSTQFTVTMSCGTVPGAPTAVNVKFSLTSPNNDQTAIASGTVGP